MTERMAEITLFTLCVVYVFAVLARCRRCIHQSLSAVGIDTNTENAANTVVDIEGNSCFRMDSNELHADIVK